MNTRRYAAYNLARGVLLNSRLTLADSGNQPLKLLDIVISGMGMDSSAGLWLNPLHAIPAVPRVFPFDILYLDKEYRVLDTAEMGPGIEFPAFHVEVASALILPPNTLIHTKTVVHDHLIVCVSNELEALLAAASLPAPDAAPPVNGPEAINPCLDASSKAPRLPDLPHQRAQVSSSAPATAFDHSVLSAVAKVAETRSALEPKHGVGAHRSLDSEPSPPVLEAAYREVQPAIIEHHIDPEDLFSNWVVSAPPSPQTGRMPPLQPPATLKPETVIQDAASEPPRQNGRKSPQSAKPATGSVAQTRTASAYSAPPKAQSKARSGTSEKPVAPAKSKHDTPTRNSGPINATSYGSAPPPITTFTAVPYGMWQISTPTGAAPMTGAKSPTPAVRPVPPGREKESSQATVPAPSTTASPQAAPPAEKVRQAFEASAQTIDSAQVTAPISPAIADTASFEPAPPASTAPSMPLLRDSQNSEAHKPGDFVASLQEKLQRARQSRTASSPAPETQPISATAQPESAAPEPAIAPAHSIRPAMPSPKLDPAHPKTKPEPALGSLRAKFKHWLNPGSSPSDRRRSSRRYVPGMVAHYFTGGAPKPKDVADISMSGMYLLTDDRWMPGTMIQMTLQKPCATGEKRQSINVLSRIIRRGSDGVAVEFVMPEALSHISHDIQPSQATDKFALARFL